MECGGLGPSTSPDWVRVGLESLALGWFGFVWIEWLLGGAQRVGSALGSGLRVGSGVCVARFVGLSWVEGWIKVTLGLGFV